MDDMGPSLTIGSETSNITDDVVDLEAPPAIDLSELNSLDASVAPTPELPITRVADPAVATPVSTTVVTASVPVPVATPVATPIIDIDMPLTDTSDFVELA
jgi:hypothetical protein